MIRRRQVLVGEHGAVVNRERFGEIAFLAPDAGLRGQRADAVPVDPPRLLIIVQRAVEIARAFAGLRPPHVIGGARLKAHGAVEIAERAGVVALAQEDLAAAAVRRGAVGAEADRLLVILQRAVGVAEVAPHCGAIDVRRGRLWIEADGGVIVGQRLAVIAARVPGIAAVLVGRRKIRRQLDRAVEIGDGVRNVAAVEKRQPAQPIGHAKRLLAQTA